MGEDNVIKAAQEFEVPSGTRILLILPEMQYRDVLGKYEKYRCEKESKGIKTPCPWCSSNDHVEYTNFTGRKSGSIRVIRGYKEFIPVITFICNCTNKKCSGDPKKRVGDDSDKVSGHQFMPYSPEVWSAYPEELRDKYSDVLHTQVADGAAGEIFVTDELLRETLKDDVLFSQLADE